MSGLVGITRSVSAAGWLSLAAAPTFAVMGCLALLIWALTRQVRTAPMFNA